MFEEYLIEILERGLEKHGEKPLTNKWLLNIIKAVKEKMEYDEVVYDDITISDDWGDG